MLYILLLVIIQSTNTDASCYTTCHNILTNTEIISNQISNNFKVLIDLKTKINKLLDLSTPPPPAPPPMFPPSPPYNPYPQPPLPLLPPPPLPPFTPETDIITNNFISTHDIMVMFGNMLYDLFIFLVITLTTRSSIIIISILIIMIFVFRYCNMRQQNEML